MAQIQSPVQEQYLAEYLALIAAGANHDEAIAQVAQSNEIDAEAVAA